jgi:hypothetical protein
MDIGKNATVTLVESNAGEQISIESMITKERSYWATRTIPARPKAPKLAYTRSTCTNGPCKVARR